MKESVKLVMDAVDKCVEDGTLSRTQRVALKVMRRVRPRSFASRCDDLVQEVASEERIGLDPDNFERLLQLLIEYLPQLLAIILPLFQGDD